MKALPVATATIAKQHRMATPVHAQQPQSSLTESTVLQTLGSVVDVLSKGIVGIVLALYASGFLITSLHQSKYGFVEVNPFRPRILAAGAWFVLFTGIPVAIVTSYWAAHRQMNWKAVANFLYFFYMICTGLSWPALIFFSLTGQQTFKTWVLVVGALGIVALIIVRESKRIPDYVSAFSSICLVLLFLISAVWPMGVAHQFQQPSITLWLFGIGAATLFVLVTIPPHLRDGRWSQPLFYALFALFLFASYYYPHIKTSWAGGNPVPVTLYFTKDSALKPNQSVSAQLLDETDAGFYIVGSNEDKAIFVPRNAVSLVYFSDKVSESKLLK